MSLSMPNYVQTKSSHWMWNCQQHTRANRTQYGSDEFKFKFHFENPNTMRNEWTNTKTASVAATTHGKNANAKITISMSPTKCVRARDKNDDSNNIDMIIWLMWQIESVSERARKRKTDAEEASLLWLLLNCRSKWMFMIMAIFHFQ